LVNLVLDASAAFELVLESSAGQSILDKLPPAPEWWAPEHYLVETAAALRRAEYTGAVTAAQASAAFSRLEAGTLHRVQVRPLLAESWKRRGHLTIADALYVVLAEQVGATLVTADLNLAGSPGLVVATITP
jgi:predicted nucleic acid-binding protein